MVHGFFLLLKATAKSNRKHFANASKSKKGRQAIAIVEKAINLKRAIKTRSEEIISKQELKNWYQKKKRRNDIKTNAEKNKNGDFNREENNIAIAILENEKFNSTIIILHFGCINDNFADCNKPEVQNFRGLFLEFNCKWNWGISWSNYRTILRIGGFIIWIAP